jgi:plasmid maintenance system antidote protein VapI
MRTQLVKTIPIESEAQLLALMRGFIAAKQIKQSQLAKDIGVTPDVLSKTLNGKIGLKQDIRDKLIQELGLNII